MKRFLILFIICFLYLSTVPSLAEVSSDLKCFEIEGTTLVGINVDTEGCSHADLVIPNTVTELNVGLYYDTNYRSITVPDSVKKITGFSFDSLYTTIIADKDSAMARWAATVRDGNGDLYIRLVDPQAGDFTIVGDVLTAYSGNSETVVIPKNVKSIGGLAFKGTINNLEHYHSYGFSQFDKYRVCSAKKIILPEGLTDIGYLAINGCDLLEEINFPESLTRIGSYALGGCDLLSTIILPSALQKLGIWSLSGLTNLKELEIPESIQDVGTQTLLRCDNLKDIYLPRAVKIDDASHTYQYLDINHLEIPENTIIHAWRDSDAAKWALENNRPLVYRDDVQTGDVDGDGQINMDDLIDLIHVLLDDPVHIRGEADINGDGVVNMDDLIIMVHILLGDPVNL